MSRYEGLDFVVNDYKKASSDYWHKPVQELVETLRYYDDASIDLRKNIWPQCARAYLCRRDLPKFESMELIDNSPLGETDVWDSINFLTDAIMSAQMPRDQSYLELLSVNGEDQGMLNNVRDLLMSVHRKADTRSQYSKHVKQTLVYGTSALWWRWQRVTKQVRKGIAQTMLKLRSDPNFADMDPKELEVIAKRTLINEVSFNGPIIRPIDMYDFWIDPVADMSRQNEHAIITRFYMTPEELENATDENGDKRFENTEGVSVQSLDQIFADQAERQEIMNELGISPLANARNNVKLVPVYCFHAPLRTFESDKSQKFVDTFFYIAKSEKHDGWQMLRVEDSPYPNGSRGIYVDTYVDWTTNGYGIGAVEKSVNAWEYKNLIAALGLQQQVMAVAPMYSVLEDALPNESSLKLGPGAVTFVKSNKNGHAFIAPIPAPADKVQIGQGTEQWYGQKILGQMQAYGAIMQDPTKSIKSAKTATQINTESTSGSVVRDNFLEKMVLRSLEPLMQDVYDAARIYMSEEINQFERSIDGEYSIGTVSRDDLDQDRKVLVTGYHGMVNKAREMEEAQNALQVLTTGNALEQLPQLKPIMQELVIKILGRLGIKNLDKYKQDPVQMLLADPMIRQKLLQDPTFSQVIQQTAQGVLSGQFGDTGAPGAAEDVPPAGASFGGQEINLQGPQGDRVPQAGPEQPMAGAA